VTSNNRLDFGDDPNRDAHRGIFKGIFLFRDWPVGIAELYLRRARWPWRKFMVPERFCST